MVWSLDQARIRGYSDRQLLIALRRGIPKPERKGILGEVERRIREGPTSFEEGVVSTLTGLNERDAQPGPAAQETDRLLHRLLRHLQSKAARALALACAESSRLQRRRAAWRFYAAQGLDASARTVAAASAKVEFPDQLSRLVAHDAELLELVGLESSLTRIEEAYWRGRVLETWLAAGKPPPDLLPSYPSEALFAIRRAKRRDLLAHAIRLFQANRSDPDVVSSAIQAFGSLKARAAERLAVKAGIEILDQVPEPERDWMGLKQGRQRLAADPLEFDNSGSDRVVARQNTHSEPTLW